MNIALWIVQGLLAVGFMYSGWMKAFLQDKAAAAWHWVNDVPKALVILIGLAELLGAVGLILPQAVGAAPDLTPVASTGLAVIVLLGVLFHVSRKEYKEIGVNFVFLALAVFVAIGRF
ncbi:DoxX family protein [Paenibacillus sp. HB172176]|uniref:DoxX family protein n=1 Tax=Paenibacillus sp. HB172176 TaxID=2493690 RepID=UPI0014395601|nr:DoxX family protein [Paenibacillus sp. HB172176]